MCLLYCFIGVASWRREQQKREHGEEEVGIEVLADPFEMPDDPVDEWVAKKAAQSRSHEVPLASSRWFLR